jgi:hypothetical protein
MNLSFIHEGLNKLGSLELLLSSRLPRVELQDLGSLIEDVDIAFDQALLHRRDFSNDEVSGADTGLGENDTVEPVDISGWFLGYMMESGGNSALEADEATEVGEEVVGFVALHLTVLDWLSVEI